MKELTLHHLIIIIIIITIIGVNGKVLAQNVAPIIVKVVGAQGQGLSGARVVIEDSTGTTVFNGFTDEQGIVRVEVTYETYSIWVDYKGFTVYTTASVSSQAGSVSTIAINVFIEIFGQAMTFATFVLWIVILILIIGITIVIVVRLRKKKVPPPPPLELKEEQQQQPPPQPSPRALEKPAIHCPTCGTPLIWYADAKRYYCRKCIR